MGLLWITLAFLAGELTVVVCLLKNGNLVYAEQARKHGYRMGVEDERAGRFPKHKD